MTEERGGHNGQKKNKMCTMHRCVIKICVLNFKKSNQSIFFEGGGGDPDNASQTFFKQDLIFGYAIKM